MSIELKGNSKVALAYFAQAFPILENLFYLAILMLSLRSLIGLGLLLLTGRLLAQNQALALVLVDTTGTPFVGASAIPMPQDRAGAPLITDEAGRACCLLNGIAQLDSIIIQHINIGALVVRPPCQSRRR